MDFYRWLNVELLIFLFQHTFGARFYITYIFRGTVYTQSVA